MNDSPLVSVVIPAYNASKWIGETLESVLAQDFTDFEVVVVDDGSIDDTAQVVAGYGGRVCLIRKQKGGVSSARNVGIRAARGEYIAFVDADDLWAKEKLRLQVDLLKRTGLAWVYCDGVAFDDKSGRRLFRFGKANRQYDGDILKSLFLASFIPSPTPVIRRSVFGKAGLFNEKTNMRPIGEDWDMWLRIAAIYPVALIPQPLAYYRVHSASISVGADPFIKMQGCLAVVEEAVSREPARLGPLKNRALSNIYIATGRLLAVRGQTASARRMFLQAIHLTPCSILPYLYWGMAPVARWAKMMRNILYGY